MSDDPALPSDDELRAFLEAIFRKYHHDFRDYAPSSMKRRTAAAMARFRCESLTALADVVGEAPERFPELMNYLTVQVSDMFRDPAFFKDFRERIVPDLRTYPSRKIWIAGCSSGEEAWSYAILLREEDLLANTLVYATDINPDALDRARAGIYPLDRVAAFSANHAAAGGRASLSTYYRTGYGSAIFDRSLRDGVVFSDHNLATDHVFAEVQVVSCRNVLIYFDEALQERALGLFRGSLCRRGYLGLGARETLRYSTYRRAFDELGSSRWYRRC